MAKLSVKERLLKRKDDILKIEVRLDEDTTVYVHEMSEAKMDELRKLCKKGDKVDGDLLEALVIIEAVHEADGSKALTAEMKQEIGITNDVEFVNLAYRVGEKERIQQALAEAAGYVEPKQAAKENEELKN